MPRNRFWIRLIAVLCWMALIFFFSAQDAEQSSRTSGRVVETVAEHFVSGYRTMKPAQQLSIRQVLSFYVRKAAHFSEFMVLGFLLVSWGRTFLADKTVFPAAWGAGVLYALSDELHQFFSDGRSPQVPDVLIDAGGVLTGVLLFAAFAAAAARFRKHNRRQQG